MQWFHYTYSILIYSSSESLPLQVITKCWVEFPVLYGRSLLVGWLPFCKHWVLFGLVSGLLVQVPLLGEGGWLSGAVGSHSTSLGGVPCTWSADLWAGKTLGAQGLQCGHWPQSSDHFPSVSGCGLLPGILFQNNRGYFCNKISLPGGGCYDASQWPLQSPEFSSPISDTTTRKLGLTSQVSPWADTLAGRPRVWRRKRLRACARMPPPSCWI